MRLCLRVLYLVLLVLLLFCQYVAPSVRGDVEIIRLKPRPEDKPVLEWSVSDVVEWMNHTIGYSEYSSYVLKHLVDGPTLLEMEPADFENFFPITNPLHVIKIQAHIKLLRGKCSCRDTASINSKRNFWSYMRQHSVRTWTEGTMSLYFPRLAMLSAFLFDHQLYLDVTRGSPTTKSHYDKVGNVTVNPGSKYADALHSRKLVYWISWLLAPDLYLGYQSTKLWSGNYFLMTFMILHFITQAVNEYFLFYSFYSKTLFTPGTGFLARVWSLYAYTIFFPFAGLFIGYFFPVLLQYICMFALVIHNFVILIGLLLIVFLKESVDSSRRQDKNKDKEDLNTKTHTSTNEVQNKNIKLDAKID